MIPTSARHTGRSVRFLFGLTSYVALAVVIPGATGSAAPLPSEALLPEVRNNAPAPKPEPVVITTLPLPPTAPTDSPGTCTRNVNPRGTGCMSASERGMQEGPGYMWDNRHVLMTVVFSGAPAAPDPANIFSGPQVIAIRTDGTVFPNGDAWKCLTCGVPEENRKGTLVSDDPMSGSGRKGSGPSHPPRMPLDHPQAFPDGKRVLAGPNVLDCSPFLLTSPECTPGHLRIYPVRWARTADGSGSGAVFREQRLSPDGVHMNWNAFAPSASGIEQFGYLGRLVFNPAPKTGNPLVPRYDIEDVYLLVNNRDPSFQSFAVDPKNPGRLIHNEPGPQTPEIHAGNRRAGLRCRTDQRAQPGSGVRLAGKLRTGQVRA